MVFKKNSLFIARRELESYLELVEIGNKEQHGMILGHACLIFAQLNKKAPFIRKLIEQEHDAYGRELGDLVLQTNSLIAEYAKDNDSLNAAGVKLWNETFRCLCYLELTPLGKKIWAYFSEAQGEASEYLNKLEARFVERNNQNMVDKVKEAKNCLYLIPSRYKKN